MTGDADETIEVFDSQGEAYQTAFQTFLAHTDQKEQARRRLDQLVAGLPQREAFIDAGAGNGKVTAWFVERFARTIAIEPNSHLREELARACPTAEVLAGGIVEATPPALGDLVLCSHVFYYLDSEAWMPTLIKLASWLSPQGALAVLVQNHRSDCMQMLDHFYGPEFNLQQLGQAFQEAAGQRYEVELETVPAVIKSADFATAAAIAEFILNSPSLQAAPELNAQPNAEQSSIRPPRRRAVADYLHQHFADGNGGFRFSCDQDFLIVRPRA